MHPPLKLNAKITKINGPNFFINRSNVRSARP
jgi:hypothetical protein